MLVLAVMVYMLKYAQMESHPQEANVAEVSYGKPVIVEPEYPV